MPAHSHNGSDVVVSVVTGQVRIEKAGECVDARAGDSVLVRKDEEVSLSNPGDAPAELFVAVGPANFIAGIRRWPEPTTA